MESSSRRLALATRLVAEAEDWVFDRGAEEVRVGGSAPFYLWPGVDVRWTAALALFEVLGYHVRGAELNMRCVTTHRSSPPEEVIVERVLEDCQRSSVVGFCVENWPDWVAGLERGLEHGCCFMACSGD